MLLVDITEFLRNPIRTGVQRVERELLTHWPGDVAAQVVWFDEVGGRFCPVSPEVIDFCIQQTCNPWLSTAEVVDAIAPSLHDSTSRPIHAERGDRLLLPELFSPLSRITFYRQLHSAGVELRPIIQDFLMWTNPQACNVSSVGGLNDYLDLMLLAPHRAFSSRSVREEFYRRFMRKPLGDDPVVPLGADALPRKGRAGRGAGQPAQRAPYLVCTGTLDGRKSQDEVYRAFLASAASECVDLVFVGKVPAAPQPQMADLLSSQHPRVTVVDDPDDQTMASLIENAQASIFISRNEGFGLPALESLYLGTPLAVAAQLPALSNLSSHGQLRLQGDTEDELADAMTALADPECAACLQSEISRLELPTWRQYARSIAQWASS